MKISYIHYSIHNGFKITDNFLLHKDSIRFSQKINDSDLDSSEMKRITCLGFNFTDFDSSLTAMQKYQQLSQIYI